CRHRRTLASKHPICVVLIVSWNTRRCTMSKHRMRKQAPSETPIPNPSPSSPAPTADMTARLNAQLKDLRLPTFREQFQTLAEQATREGLSYPQYLAELASRECQTRNH